MLWILAGCAAVGPLPVNIDAKEGAHAEIVETAQQDLVKQELVFA